MLRGLRSGNRLPRPARAPRQWKTIYDRFVLWSHDRIAVTLRERLDCDGRIVWDMSCVDGTSIRAPEP